MEHTRNIGESTSHPNPKGTVLTHPRERTLDCGNRAVYSALGVSAA